MGSRPAFVIRGGNPGGLDRAASARYDELPPRLRSETLMGLSGSMVPIGSGQGNDRFDLDWHAHRQLCGANGRACVTSSLAPEGEDEIAESVNRRRRYVEPVSALDEAENLDPGLHLVKVA